MKTFGENKTLLNMDTIYAHKSSKAAFILGLIIFPLIIALLGISIGRYYIPVADVWQVLFSGKADTQQLYAVVWSMRLPRIILALICGGGLAVAGAAFQSLFGNPLATPDTLGVAAGASFGAVIALLWGYGLITVQLFALVGGFVAIAITYLISWRREGGSLTMVILAGLVVSSLFSAWVSLVKYLADSESQLPTITYWLMGSLSSASFSSLKLGAPFIIIGIIVLLALRWRLNILPLSDDEARASGTDLRLLRILTALSATMITASSVSMCGQVGWVGLLIPHICRMAFGSNNLVLIPSSISLGAAFMVIMDTAARSMTASEIPISILTAIIGAPFFIGLLRRTGGWNI